MQFVIVTNSLVTRYIKGYRRQQPGIVLKVYAILKDPGMTREDSIDLFKSLTNWQLWNLKFWFFFVLGWHRAQPTTPRTDGVHDLPREAGRQAQPPVPQPVHEQRRKVDHRLWPQGHLQTGQGWDPRVLQKGKPFNKCVLVFSFK